MPTYEYRCKSCNHQFDVVQSFTDQPLSECPECGGALRKVFGSVGITFKGSGFYKTDSRSGGSSGDGEKVGAGKEAGGKDGDKASSDSGSTASSNGDGKAATPSKEVTATSAKKAAGTGSSESSPSKRDTTVSGSKTKR